jgi:hypothetical protein
MPEGKLIATLRALHDGGIDFILVGGLKKALNRPATTEVAAVLQ